MIDPEILFLIINLTTSCERKKDEVKFVSVFNLLENIFQQHLV